MPELESDSVGARIKKLRLEAKLTLPQLAAAAGVSKSYIWNLENKPQHQRPSAETLFSIANVLNSTVAELLGRKLQAEVSDEADDILRKFASQENIPEGDVRMLASIRWRGDPPRTVERWRFVYDALKVSRSIDSK